MTWYRILLYCPWPFWHGINTITRASIALWPSLKKKKQFANRSDTSPGPISSFLKKKKKKTCVCRSTIEFPLGHDSWATRLTSCASEEKNDRYWQMFFFFAYRSSEEEEKTVNDKRNKIFGNVSLTCDDGDDVTWIPDGASAAPRDWTFTSSDLRSKHQRSPQRSRTEQLLPQQRRPGQFKFSFLLKTRKPASHWFTDCFFPTTTHALLECFFRRTDTKKRFSCKE